ncbi:Asp23/Gls24 family envelope stress response protein [Amycolatopsis sp. lyj-112]|uniref:Asp23/Gls24 family envelope stress response protein n=1 Tax=Amycolatopsis sp. lyj-112 TaxID=2789288 RepID=UPI00397D1792
MSDVINSIFGRAKNETPRPGGYGTDSTTAEPHTFQADAADVAVADETLDTKANEVDQTETVEPAGSTTESEDIAADADLVTETADEDELAESSTETVPAVDADIESPEEDGGIAEGTDAVALESVDAPVAVVAESDEDDVEQTESAVEPVTAETRPAAGSRGNTTVGDGVVAKVVTRMALKAEGVYGLDDEGISVELDGDIATIKVSVVVEFGHVVMTVAEQTRIAVIEAVEQFLSLDVAGVDVHVTDIHLPDSL